MSSENWITGGKTISLDKDYELGSSIGQPGQFGEAYKITERKTGERRAVKVVSKHKFRNEHDKKFHFAQLREEIRIMKELKHDNIIELFNVYESAGHLYIVMQLCEGGELFDRIQDQPDGSFSEADAQKILKQIIDGLAFLHAQKIAHCDLKPDNFLFLTKDKDSPLKIIDFGMSKHIPDFKKKMTSFRGTPYYVAPEVLEGFYTKSCDIWSFGVVMFVMLFGYPPFHANSDDDIFKKIKKGFCPQVKKGYGAWFPSAMNCSEAAKDLLAKCLNAESKRITAEEIQNHHFFTSKASTTPMDSMLKNLKDFQTKVQFKAKVLEKLYADFTTNEDMRSLEDEFKKMDVNGDQSLDMEEMVEALAKTGVTRADAENLFKAVDIDGDGTVSYQELLLTATDRKLGLQEERQWAAFCKIDTDSSGHIDESELVKLLDISQEEAKVLIKEVDVDSDGKVSFDEFKKMWSATKKS